MVVKIRNNLLLHWFLSVHSVHSHSNLHVFLSLCLPPPYPLPLLLYLYIIHNLHTILFIHSKYTIK